jgi:hypothetical protein
VDFNFSELFKSFESGVEKFFFLQRRQVYPRITKACQPQVDQP